MEADQAMILVANDHDLDVLIKHPFESKFTEYSMLDFCSRDAMTCGDNYAQKLLDMLLQTADLSCYFSMREQLYVQRI
jgi:hypothetical protein